MRPQRPEQQASTLQHDVVAAKIHAHECLAATNSLHQRSDPLVSQVVLPKVEMAEILRVIALCSYDLANHGSCVRAQALLVHPDPPVLDVFLAVLEESPLLLQIGRYL